MKLYQTSPRVSIPFSLFFCRFLKIVSVSLKKRLSVFSPAPKYGILGQKEVCRLKDNRINFDLERKLRRYAISDLMKYIVIGQGIVFALLYIWPTLGYQLYSLITLTRTGLMRGQIWRLVTFVFVPPSSSPIFILFALYFYYMIGVGLENRWGKVKFNLYYLVGMIGSIIAALITGYADNTFLNLSLFFAYAALYPDEQVLLFMILPIKMKYLALVDAALYLYSFIVGAASTRITIVLCLLNVALFLGGDIINTIRRESKYWKTRYNFRKAMRK